MKAVDSNNNSRSGEREDRAIETTDASEAIKTCEANDVIGSIVTEANVASRLSKLNRAIGRRGRSIRLRMSNKASEANEASETIETIEPIVVVSTELASDAVESSGKAT